jgi:hypothetical protein
MIPLFAIKSLNSGGAHYQLVESVKGIEEKGNEVSFISYHYYYSLTRIFKEPLFYLVKIHLNY